MAQTMNFEVIPKLKEIIAEFEEDVIPAFGSVATDIVEVAEYTELPNLIKSAKDCAEKADAIGKMFKEVVEVLTNYVDKYEKVGKATGAI